MRSKRITRTTKCQDENEKVKKYGTGSSGANHLTRVGETRSFLSTSTPAKQSTKTGGETVLSDDTDDEISLALRDTPTGLRMKGFFRDEFLSSQTTDSQLDVRWDHTSPDAYKRLQRVPRKSLKQAREDLSDIVCRLAPAVSAEGEELESVSSTPPLLCSWLQANKATSQNAPFEGQIFKHGQRTKRGLKKKKKASVQKFDDVLNNLHMCLERLDHEEDEENNKTDIHQRSSRSSTEDDSGVKDQNRNLVKTDHFNGNVNPSLRAETSLLPKDAARALLEEEEDLWSDDELFEDNSFILQATQLPADKISRFSPSLCGGKRKQISPVLDQPKNKTKRCAVSPKWEKQSDSNDLIPPTCATKSNFTVSARSQCVNNNYNPNPISKSRMNGNMEANANNNLNYTRQNSAGFKPGVSKCETHSSAKSLFRKHSSFSGYETKNPQACASSSTVTTNIKSPLRKVNSFSGRYTGSNTNQHRQPAPSTRPVPQIQNSPTAGQCKPSAQTYKKNVSTKEIVSNKKQVSPVSKRNSLDTSWSDEILRQLAEPDEIFESQINVVTTVPEANKELHGEFEDFFSSDDDFSVNETIMSVPPTQKLKKCSDVNNVSKSDKSYALPKPCTTVQQPKCDVQKNKLAESNQNGLSLNSNSATVIRGTTSSATADKTSSMSSRSSSSQSSNQKTNSQSRFTFRSSTRQQMPSKPPAIANTSSLGVGSKLPPKQHQNDGSGVRVNGTMPDMKKLTAIKPRTAAPANAVTTVDDNISDTQILMSSQSLLEDDSFMKDDALFESQILAMLDEVESTQQSKPDRDAEADKISCSPEEIEKKRLAALAKRKEKAKR